MVIDAYRAVSFVCTDGLKLLMFVKFCQEANIILLNEGNFFVSIKIYLTPILQYIYF